MNLRLLTLLFSFFSCILIPFVIDGIEFRYERDLFIDEVFQNGPNSGLSSDEQWEVIKRENEVLLKKYRKLYSSDIGVCVVISFMLIFTYFKRQDLKADNASNLILILFLFFPIVLGREEFLLSLILPVWLYLKGLGSARGQSR